MSSLVVDDCLIDGNAAYSSSGQDAMAYGGGAIYCYGGTPQVRDTILWANQNDITVISGSVTASYCCIQGGYTGVGNISDDPLFVSGPLGDYYLSCEAAGQGANSPCIDAGSDTAEALGPDEAPTIECNLNADRFSTGDQLVGLYEISNPGPDITVDVYFAFVMPDGAILCISPTRIDFGIFPCMTPRSFWSKATRWRRRPWLT